jgi:hypothetical protein
VEGVAERARVLFEERRRSYVLVRETGRAPRRAEAASRELRSMNARVVPGAGPLRRTVREVDELRTPGRFP